jgi:hypothetical protein
MNHTWNEMIHTCASTHTSDEEATTLAAVPFTTSTDGDDGDGDGVDGDNAVIDCDGKDDTGDAICRRTAAITRFNPNRPSSLFFCIIVS